MFNKKKLIFIFQFLFVLVFCFSCGRIKEYTGWWIDDLEYKVEHYNGTKLRMDGYYYKSYDSSRTDFDVMFFYNNGVIQSADILNINDYNSLDSLIIAHDWSKNKKWRDNWGAYRVKEELFVDIQRWYKDDWADRLCLFTGIILNDSQLVVNTSRYKKRFFSQKYYIENEYTIYNFRQLDFKPDSINKFIVPN